MYLNGMKMTMLWSKRVAAYICICTYNKCNYLCWWQ